MQKICSLNEILVNTGVAALYKDKQVAIFRPTENEIYAIDNTDPFSGSNVLSRGLIGETQDILFVASPIYKQRFNLKTGECLDDENVKLNTYLATIENEHVYLT